MSPDRVRTTDHPGDQREDLRGAFAPPFAAVVSRSASSLASPHRWASAVTGTSAAQDEVRIVEPHADRAATVR
jgi:hypothetical protein